MPTQTTLMACASTGEEFLINKSYISKIENDEKALFMSAAHECRHLWQIRNLKDNFIENYKQSKGDVEDYNAQFLEIDAWAWTKIVMAELFGQRPNLEKILSQQIIEQIEKRINEIIKEEF